MPEPANATAEGMSRSVRPPTQHCAFVRELLPEHVMALLDPEAAAAVREHLSICGACRAEQEELTGIVELLAPIRDVFPLITDMTSSWFPAPDPAHTTTSTAGDKADAPGHSRHAPTDGADVRRTAHRIGERPDPRPAHHLCPMDLGSRTSDEGRPRLRPSRKARP